MPITPVHRSSCLAASTPSCQTLPHAEAWASPHSLTIWLPSVLGTRRHQLEKGYLVLLRAGWFSSQLQKRYRVKIRGEEMTSVDNLMPPFYPQSTPSWPNTTTTPSPFSKSSQVFDFQKVTFKCRQCKCKNIYVGTLGEMWFTKSKYKSKQWTAWGSNGII